MSSIEKRQEDENMIGIIQNDIHQAGTRNRLRIGDKVYLTPATNTPNGEDKYYARQPMKMESILIDRKDVKIV